MKGNSVKPGRVLKLIRRWYLNFPVLCHIYWITDSDRLCLDALSVCLCFLSLYFFVCLVWINSSKLLKADLYSYIRINIWVSYVLQNTITNADKLLAAADELAQTGECDPQEIYSEARLLEERMNNFLTRVERRRNLLDMSVAFYTHTKEVNMAFLYMFVLWDISGLYLYTECYAMYACTCAYLCLRARTCAVCVRARACEETDLLIWGVRTPPSTAYRLGRGGRLVGRG